ncbi:ubiquitin ligase complex subunit [Maudiozyma humilis]|uniref:Ubiquitin ligase complex subunit n=1 Tax=Maudiozyma humilis TaxID=51915 RepID=A0AAV5RY45_MAUHU|nr:ubiquitin ligase complex subunit [Kazachstania humilis]
MKLSSLIAALLVTGNVYAEDSDTWQEAQSLMSQLHKKTNVLKEQPHSIVGGSDISVYVPVNYNDTHEREAYTAFWERSDNEEQQHLYHLLLDSSENHNNSAAAKALAEMHFYSDYGVPHNKLFAYYFLDKYNELTEHQDAEMLFQQAVAYATGLFGTIEIDSAKAMLYYQRSARLGSLKAKQVLAYKYFSGINVPRDFNRALILYKEIAEQLRETYSEEEWLFRFPYEESFSLRLPDFKDGLLGTGLSQMQISTYRRKAARPDVTSSVLTNINDGKIILRFGSLESTGPFAFDEENDDDDQLVDIYYTAFDDYKGTYTTERNVSRARLILEATYEQYDDEVGYLDNLQRFFYGKCLDLLGHIYLTGEGQEKPDILRAEKILKRSALVVEAGSTLTSDANIDLGIISQYYLHNDTKAIEHYKRSRDKTMNDGLVEYQLSKLSEKYPEMYLGDPFRLMQFADSKGFLPARYEFALMAEQGVQEKYNCEDTAYRFKLFVEELEDKMAPHLRTAFNELLLGNTEAALWLYTQAAEQGYEMAQVTAGYLLYQTPYELEDEPQTSDDRRLAAVTYYTRAFRQGNIDAGVVAGDAYYSLGQYDKAFSLYQSAALKYSSQAIWNLGYMYEYGLGVPVDFHLAKRYYDQALEHNNKLFLAIKLNVVKLQVKAFLASVLGRDILPYAQFEKLRIAFFTSLQRLKERIDSVRILSFLHAPHSTGPDRRRKITIESRLSSGDSGEDSIASGILDGLGVVSDDLMTLAVICLFFFGSFILRRFAARRGWNVEINGVPLAQPNGAQPDDQQPRGGINVQFFAI